MGVKTITIGIYVFHERWEVITWTFGFIVWHRNQWGSHATYRSTGLKGVVALERHKVHFDFNVKLLIAPTSSEFIEMFPTKSLVNRYSNSPPEAQSKQPSAKINCFLSFSNSPSHSLACSLDLLFHASAFHAYIWDTQKNQPSLSICANFELFFYLRVSLVDVNQRLFETACVSHPRESAKTSIAVDWLSHCPFSLVSLLILLFLSPAPFRKVRLGAVTTLETRVGYEWESNLHTHIGFLAISAFVSPIKLHDAA